MKIVSLDELLRLLDGYNHDELHLHHTWKPAHKSFNGKNHLTLQTSMQKYHKRLGWSDIGQHITVFPDGSIMTGRDFGRNPGSITGHNTNSFSCEILGNFDLENAGEYNELGYDVLEGKQLETVLAIGRYFDRKGRYIRFHNENSTKSCPGTGVDKDEFMKKVKGVEIKMLKYVSLVKNGSRGNHIKELQNALNALGYDCGVADGIAGTKTVNGIKAFQKANNLVVDGLAGKNTYNKLNEILNKNHNPLYKEMRRYSSNVNILEIPKDYIVDVELGKYAKLERVSSVVAAKLKEGKDVVAAVNCGFFWKTLEHIGMLIDEGLYYTPPTSAAIDFIYYKNGTTEIKNLSGYNGTLLSGLQKSTNWAIGTSYSLVQKGKINLENSGKYSHAKGREPRTLIGQKADGTFVLVVVDGRRITSLGVTAQQSAEIMLDLGCYNAVNVDGGGSSVMVVVENGKVKVVNKPSDGSERAVGSMLLVYAK